MIRVLTFTLLLMVGVARAQTLTIAAAASLQEAITAASSDFKAAAGTPVELTFGGSGQLLAQIRSGAPIDAFISAAPREMDSLEKEGLLAEGTRREILQNTLVLIAPAGSRLGSFDQLTAGAISRVAIGDPKTVPAGLYAQETLTHLNLYAALEPKIILAANVRQVLDYVVTGNADAGLVYGTDAKQVGDRVKVVTIVDETTHEPIRYPGAVLKRSSHASAAKQFLDFLSSPAGFKEFTARGFGASPASAATRP